MRLPIQVSIFIVRLKPDGDREYLLLHRVLPRLSFWQPVTGGVESGETIEQTARRELIEETGFLPDDLQPIGFTYTFPPDEFFKAVYETLPDEIAVHVFVASVMSGSEPKIDAVEHDEYIWYTYGEALDILYWWDDKESLKQVAAFLKRTQQ
ncbi:MAG: NUDIX domain-containing protein [candidate division Zixibacteria bacterium]|nr:NUDIX domain-containing protein [candidate division Zixibacteria bacterium]